MRLFLFQNTGTLILYAIFSKHLFFSKLLYTFFKIYFFIDYNITLYIQTNSGYRCCYGFLLYEIEIKYSFSTQ